jgi:hypothetical protein
MHPASMMDMRLILVMNLSNGETEYGGQRAQQNDVPEMERLPLSSHVA